MLADSATAAPASTLGGYPQIRSATPASARRRPTTGQRRREGRLPQTDVDGSAVRPGDVVFGLPS